MTQPITNPSGWLTAMAARLGINRFAQWIIREEVSPVAIVDSYVTLAATSQTPLLGVPISAGELVAPAANTRLADSGALAAGNWALQLLVSAQEGMSYRLRRRNAADAADVWSMRFTTGPVGATLADPFLQFSGRFSVAAGERFVIENVIVGTGGITHQANIWLTAA